MNIGIHLLGRPRLEGSAVPYEFRSRKSWAVLAYLLLTERPPTRRTLAALLFGEAADPLRALRWSLAEIRRGLGGDAVVDGDPVVLRLAPGAVVDVDVVAHGAWREALALPGLGGDLLEGWAFRDAPAFESWLLGQQRRVAAVSEAILHEAALATMASGDLQTATDHALRASAMNPLDENHHVLLIRLYRLRGDELAAERQHRRSVDLLDGELGVAPRPALDAALREEAADRQPPGGRRSIEAILEAGGAAVSAGAVEAGLQSFRSAAALADAACLSDLRIRARLLLAETLIHSLRGRDEEGLGALFAADQIAQEAGDQEGAAQARAEIGYVDFLRARYDRAERWLNDAHSLAGGSPTMEAKVAVYLGSIHSDRGDYSQAAAALAAAYELAAGAGEPRRQAYALSMLGRIDLLQRSFDDASARLDESIALAEGDHWLSFLPWPQALHGEVELAQGRLDMASDLLEQAFARATQVGDPCWEGMSLRGLALVADARGRAEGAVDLLDQARARCNRFADPYVWLDGYILDARCELAVRHRHKGTQAWINALLDLAARTGMRDLHRRALRHSAAMGNDADGITAALL